MQIYYIENHYKLKNGRSELRLVPDCRYFFKVYIPIVTIDFRGHSWQKNVIIGKEIVRKCPFFSQTPHCVFFFNKAVYTAESVACDWAGAVMQKLPKKRQKSKCVTNRLTDRHSGVESHVHATRNTNASTFFG